MSKIIVKIESAGKLTPVDIKSLIVLGLSAVVPVGKSIDPDNYKVTEVEVLDKGKLIEIIKQGLDKPIYSSSGKEFGAEEYIKNEKIKSRCISSDCVVVRI